MRKTKLQLKIMERGLTQEEVAVKIGVTSATLCRKIASNSFSVTEAADIAKILHANPMELFFADDVT